MTREEKLWWKASAYIRKAGMAAFLHPRFWSRYQELCAKLDRPVHLPRVLHPLVVAALAEGE